MRTTTAIARIAQHTYIVYVVVQYTYILHCKQHLVILLKSYLNSIHLKEVIDEVFDRGHNGYFSLLSSHIEEQRATFIVLHCDVLVFVMASLQSDYCHMQHTCLYKMITNYLVSPC